MDTSLDADPGLLLTDVAVGADGPARVAFGAEACEPFRVDVRTQRRVSSRVANMANLAVAGETAAAFRVLGAAGARCR